jgi:hypothetical protein
MCGLVDVRNVIWCTGESFLAQQDLPTHTHTQQWPPIHAGTAHHAPIGASGAVKITASFFDAAACATAVAANTTTTHEDVAILLQAVRVGLHDS